MTHRSTVEIVRSRVSTRGGPAAVAVVALVASLLVALAPTSAHANQRTSEAIHIMAFPSADAIILESNGRFAFVDSGEDRDYPDGSDPRYPWRAGIVTGSTDEDTLWAYLDELGVNETNVEFYLGTHAHSDHIGTADTVISRYRPERIYTPEYSDAWITDPARLWDNQYVYDRMMDAARNAQATYGAALIQRLSPGAPLVPDRQGGVASPEFDFGDMHIEIVNYGEDYKTNPVPDANHMSWGVKVTAHGRSVFLAADIDNTAGAEDRLAGQIGDVDVLKLAHHGLAGSNSQRLLQALAPELAFQTGYYTYLDPVTEATLNRQGTRWYPADEVRAWGGAAVVITLARSGVSIGGVPDGVVYRRRGVSPHVVAYQGGRPSAQSGWRRLGDSYYWFDGRTQAVEGSWRYEGGSWYYLRADGAMSTGWLNLAGTWYYFASSGAMSTGWVRDGASWYYLRADGAMSTGWLNLAGTCYYFASSGAMSTGWVRDGESWYYLASSGAMVTGWLNLAGTWYYFDDSGAMVTGRVQTGSRISEFSSSGAWLGYRS